MAFTIVPLHNLDLPTGTHIPFAGGFTLADLPSWVKDDEFLTLLGHNERESVRSAKQALVAEYDADAIGEPDLSWKGKEQRSIQDGKVESAMLANLALWLRQPSAVCYTLVVHGLHWQIRGTTEKQPALQSANTYAPLHCHPKDVSNPFREVHAVEAAALHGLLLTVPRNNAVWTALRALWLALTVYSPDIRYTLFWLGLEALFGADDNSGEISYKLAQRIAFFLGDTPQDAKTIFATAKKCYATRSKIVHGKWKDDSEIDIPLGDTEGIVRTAIRRLLNDAKILSTFTSKHRDRFLEDWVFSRAVEHPPTPQ